ncbi:putative heavy metal-associated domain superfamily [Helianthus annuus]|nr:putative heavy metal-associated domain superfamily [Helianthus annuus]
MLQSLYLTGCPNLKSLSCLPSRLKRLRVGWCTSLERITFQSARFTLEMFYYEGCFKLFEIEGLFKLVSIEKLDEADLGYMQWIKAYKDHKVDLVGDEITKGRTWNIQKWKVTLGVNFNSESEIKKIEKAVYSVPGVESVSYDKEIGRLIVIGRFDHQAVVTCVREFEKMVQVLGRKII